jgi:hypothetical protein
MATQAATTIHEKELIFMSFIQSAIQQKCAQYFSSLWVIRTDFFLRTRWWENSWDHTKTYTTLMHDEVHDFFLLSLFDSSTCISCWPRAKRVISSFFFVFVLLGLLQKLRNDHWTEIERAHTRHTSASVTQRRWISCLRVWISLCISLHDVRNVN